MRRSEVHPIAIRRSLMRIDIARYSLTALAMTLAIAAAAPGIAVLSSLVAPFGENIRHTLRTVGAEYAAGTLALSFGAAILASLIGVGAALLTGLGEFPFRHALTVALALPLAVPAYIAAYAYGDFFGPFGAVAAIAGPAHGIDIRSLPGAILVLALTLYPYVYLPAHVAFSTQSGPLIEAARLLGAAPGRIALRLLAPVARPAIVGGAALVMMEAAAEFGVADYFGVSTLSVGVFRTWNAFGDLVAASQLASFLFLFVLMLIIVETGACRGAAALSARVLARPLRFQLKGSSAVLAFAACLLPPLVGAALPAFVIASKIDAAHLETSLRGLGDAFGASAMVGSAGAAITLAAAIILAYAQRRASDAPTRFAIRAATLGYALPGAVIAIGALSAFSVASLGQSAAAGGFFALVYAYAVRFVTAGYNVFSAGLAKAPPAIDDAAMTLGATPWRALARIHAPMLRGSAAAAAIIIFIDILKELPATLILRGFNFETLATRVYRLASDERLAEAAPAALTLIAVGVIPAVVFSRLSAGRPFRR